jgi:hypothetical protein
MHDFQKAVDFRRIHPSAEISRTGATLVQWTGYDEASASFCS